MHPAAGLHGPADTGAAADGANFSLLIACFGLAAG